MQMPYAPALFAEVARSLGYHPFPIPSANLSRAYTNPLGIEMAQCTFCGFCKRFGCANYSKASAQTAVLPVLMRKENFEARTECEVMKINLDSSGKHATGVTYVDSSGTQFEQPADIVLVCAFSLNNVHMLLVSGIGRPYDPISREGTIGRNYAYQTLSSAQLFFDDKIFNPFIGSGSSCLIMADSILSAADSSLVQLKTAPRSSTCLCLLGHRVGAQSGSRQRNKIICEVSV
jgi:gluconate 2-dehydrogenase alpha chain